MSKYVFPLSFSNQVGMYKNYYGEFPLSDIQQDHHIEYGISEKQSGLYELIAFKKSNLNAKKIDILCPNHCQEKLIARNNNTLICKQCDPRLAE